MLTDDLATRALDLRFAPTKPLAAIEVEAGSAGAVRIPDAHLMFQGEYRREGFDLVIEDDRSRVVVEEYFRAGKRPDLESPDGARLTEDVVAALAISEHGTRYAQAGPPAPQAAIGRVETVTGQATVIRNGTPVVLNQGDPVFKGDVVQTDRGSSLGITFLDGSTFSLASGARMVLNDMVYQPGGTGNSALLNIVQGSVTFLAGQVAKTGDMRVGTPVATMGIRGTLVNAEISAENGTTRFSVLQEPNGEVGRYDLIRDGRVIATVSAVDQVTVVAPSGIVSAEPKSFDQQQAEQLLVQQVFQIFAIGQANPLVPGVGPAPGPSGGGGGGGGGGGSSTDPNLSGGASPPAPSGGVPSPVGPPIGNGLPPVVQSPQLQPIAFTGGVVVVDEPGDATGDATGRIVSVRVTAGGGAVPVGDGAQATIVAGTFGDLAIRADGTYVYVPLRTAPLAQGETGQDQFTYTSRSPSGELSEVTLTFSNTGVNDAPTVSGPISAPALAEGAGVGTVDLLSGAGDVDRGAVLHVENLRATGDASGSALPPGISLAADGRTLRIDPGNAAYDELALGEVRSIALSYEVVDEYGARVVQTATVTVVGTNDAPVATAAVSGAATEDTGTATFLLTANASDVDHGAVLRAQNVSWSGGAGLPPGFSLAADGVTLVVDTNDPGLSYLAEGQTQSFVLTYQVADEHGATASQTATIVVTGRNDAPAISISQPSNAVKETNDDDLGPQNVTSATANAAISDPDGSATYDLTGWQFSSSTFQYYKVGTYGTAFLDTNTGVITYELNDGDPDTNALVNGEVVYDTFSVTATDGSASTTATVSFEVQGTTDGFDGTFESGSFIGFSATGNAGIVSGSGFPEGSRAAQVATNSSVGYQDIAAFLGVPGTALASNPSTTNTSDDSTVGTAIKTIGLFLAAGQQFIFDYKFSTDDYSPYNDFAFFAVDEADQVFELADIEQVGDYGQTPWLTYRFTAQSSGVYHFGFGVMDTGDGVVSSQLLVDRVAIENAPDLVADRVRTNLSGSFEIPTSALLFNDYADPSQGPSLSVIGASPNPAATLSGDHVSVQSGTTSFTYEAADDGTRASNDAGVTLASALGTSGTIFADSGGSILISSTQETALQGGGGVDVFVLQSVPSSSGSYDLGLYDVARLQQVGSNDAVDITFLMRSGLFGQPSSGSFIQVASDSGHYDLKLALADGSGYETVAELYGSVDDFYVTYDDYLIQPNSFLLV